MSLRDYIGSGAPVAKGLGDLHNGHRCDAVCEPIIRFYQDGLSFVATGSRIGVSQGLVRLRLKAHGIASRPRGNPRGLRCLWKDHAIQLYKEGQTLEAIAKTVSRTRERVRQVLNQSGIRMRPGGRSGHTCNDACAVVLAASPPISVIQLARQIKISWGRLWRAVRIHQVPTSRGRHVCTERCTAIRDLLAAGTSVRQIGLLLHVADSGISQRFPTYHPEWNWSRKQPIPAEGLSVSPQTFRARRP